MKRALTGLLAAVSLGAAVLASTAQAKDLSVVGSWSSLPLHKQFEVPFWTKDLPADSGGAINVKMTTFDQMGIKGSDVLRMLSDGVFDVGMTVSDYAVGDAPELQGLDVPLVATTAKQARAMVNAARPMVADIMKQRFNAKLLAIAPYPPQVVFCKGNINSLADLKGKKVRGSGRMTTDFLEALGATGVNISFSEVPGALQRGVIDCAVTGAGSGYSAGWYEVSDSLYPIPLGGWDPVITAMNMNTWKSLSPKTQNLITTKIKSQFENPAWNNAAGALKNNIACLTGNGNCSAGKPAHMKLVKVTQADLDKAHRILVQKVLPEWAKQTDKKWVARWNQTVGKTVGVQVPLN
ncbi:TRAP transporter substrate-binding protein [Mangrovitalea sediminis]|uniref:TRAP transporter substrate-binding protein n=1 Tax=Mangrovitalea sediminis TaxID=1982043 RepID=UPI000BE5BF62|nr:TRAP transporter substrate-binding protein [Mangrovitalea sediminis]